MWNERLSLEAVGTCTVSLRAALEGGQSETTEKNEGSFIRLVLNGQQKRRDDSDFWGRKHDNPKVDMMCSKWSIFQDPLRRNYEF